MPACCPELTDSPAATSYISTSQKMAREAEIPEIPLNLLQIRGKGRLKGTNNYSHKKDAGKAGIKRLPSAFELAEQEERATAVLPSIAPSVLYKARVVSEAAVDLEAITITEIGLWQVDLTSNSLIAGMQPPQAYRPVVIEMTAEDTGQFEIEPEIEDPFDCILAQVGSQQMVDKNEE